MGSLRRIEVPVYAIQEFKGSYPTRSEYDEYPGEYRYKYPVAGAKNSDVSVHTYDIKDRVTRTLKVPLDADGYVPRIHFTSDPNKLAVVTLNRHQNQMDIYMANPRSTECKLAVRETNPKYVTDQPMPASSSTATTLPTSLTARATSTSIGTTSMVSSTVR